ncbi:BREX system Lon protease-like protein BrxL [Fusobacterium sp.]|uniref:BREX system Lon protease-like protein BrxL n=1 Tax=Fusobacterium sp. TaxID=68766 RepID=UPI0029045D79|nr:BREX system Lon protease-like protein BrxL [Fusobacterium sp.]MDU1911948.1 BREX system Lon protease-like protein BrxL [Fusobacterium sp.]
MENNKIEVLINAIIDFKKSLSPEERKIFIEQLLSSEDLSKQNLSFEEVPYPNNDKVSLSTVKKNDLKRLKYNETTTQIELVLEGKFEYEEDKIKFISSYLDENLYCYFIKKEQNEFLNKYEGKNQLIQAEIRYTPIIDKFTLHNIKIYVHFNPIENWIKIQKNSDLISKLSNIAKYLCIDAEKLLFFELCTLSLRLVPLVQKHYLYVELAPRGIGKTTLYEKLQYSLQSTLLTRANMFIDSRNKKNGDFLTCENSFIIDEFQKIQDTEVFAMLQIYHSGDKNTGTITINSQNKRTMDISTILLGNVPQNIDYTHIYSQKINIFKNTAIVNENDKTGDAFISRIDGLVNSAGCREFSPDMKLEELENTDDYSFTFLRSLCDDLREQKIDIKELLIRLNVNFQSNSSRSQNAVEKTFEGLVKLLYPELIANLNIRGIENELLFLYEKAIEARKTVDNMLKIIKPDEKKEDTFPKLYSYVRGDILGINGNYKSTPHRILIIDRDKVMKLPLDKIGIIQNRREKELLESLNYKTEYTESNIFSHENCITSEIIKKYLCNFETNNILNRDWSKTKEYRDSSINYDYNYLTGEYEEIDSEERDEIINFSFYNINKK